MVFATNPVPAAESLLAALRSLDTDAWGGAPRLWIATSGAVSATPTPTQTALAVAQAPFWGLARVIEMEHPGRFAAIVDLDAMATTMTRAEQLTAELRDGGDEPSVAMRGARRLVRRLTPLAAARRERRVTFRPDSTYLISGGLGGIGVSMAEWAIAQGARRLVILGAASPLGARSSWNSLDPSGAEASRVSAVRHLESLGASVHYLSVDVADAASVVAALDHWRADGWPPIRGVIHAAGVTDDRLLADLDLASLGAVLAPKATGALVLQQAIPDAEWTLLFSSLASVWPSPGQGSYAAANAFLDALAQHRAAHGHDTLSVGWGLWFGAGFGATAGGQRTAERLAERGVVGFAPADGLAALTSLLGTDAAHALIFAADRRALAATAAGPYAPPLLRNLAGTLVAPDADPAVNTRTFADELRAADGSERNALLQDRVSRHAAAVLKLADGRIDPHTPLGAYGLNSILGLELRHLLERDLALRLSATLIWNYPSVAAMATYLGERLDPAPSAPPAERPAPPAVDGQLDGAVSRVADLSDDAALRALRAAKPKPKGRP